MLAVKHSPAKRVFIPIIPIHKNLSPSSEKIVSIRKMASKNPDILKLISAFELK